MRLLIVIFFFIFPLFATTIEKEKNIKIDPSLLKEFTQYWQKRGKRDFDKTYIQELPYLQYIHTKEWYKKFFSNAPEFSKIIIKEIHNCKEDVCILGILLFRKGYSSPTYLYDKWIKLNNKWYHRFNDSPIPIFRGGL